MQRILRYSAADGTVGLAALDALFDEHAARGCVRIAYDTDVYTGRLART